MSVGWHRDSFNSLGYRRKIFGLLLLSVILGFLELYLWPLLPLPSHLSAWLLSLFFFPLLVFQDPPSLSEFGVGSYCIDSFITCLLIVSQYHMTPMALVLDSHYYFWCLFLRSVKVGVYLFCPFDHQLFFFSFLQRKNCDNVFPKPN